MAQYDEIAEQYKESRQLEIFRIISHTMSHWIGDVAGRSVLELACGEGNGARAVKQAGAGRVVGVDVSEQMIQLAREAEAKQPLGIEYIARAAQELGRIGEFDVVTATFLLHYARNRDELRDMARAAYLNLRPGCRFVTLNENHGRAANWSEEVTERYGFRWRTPAWPLNNGDPMVITLLHGASEATFTVQYFSRETYEWALEEAGFKAVRWHDMVLPPDMEANGGREFWAPCMERKPFVVIECLT
jgi:ubiquinone/menaquinone biosynthesis C-methylase UbiE